MATAESRIEHLEAQKAEWLARLNDLVSLIKGWVEPSGWHTRAMTKPLTEAGLGRYDVPILILLRDEVDIVLSPIARPVPGADGVVDFYLMPGYADLFRLCFDGEAWSIENILPRDPTAPEPVLGDHERLPLDEETINRVLDVISGHA